MENKRLLIISNRLPVTVDKKMGNFRFHQSVGGLATGLDSVRKLYDSLWIGWPGVLVNKLNKGERKIIEKKLSDFDSYPIFLSERDVELYYYGFCNRTIWPLFHCFTQHVVYDERLWNSYKSANEAFCKAVIRKAGPDDIIWVQDYQLMCLPALIREKLPEATVGFFLHTPFPPFEIFRLLPWREELLRGLLGADLIGFHTYDCIQHFIDSVRRLLGYEHTLGQITVGNRVVKADIFPMGINYRRFETAVDEAKTRREIKKIRKKVGERRIILSVDRLDYTKGIPQRLDAFDHFLEQNPQYREKVVLVFVGVPSRTKIHHYTLLKKQVDELIGKINGKYGTIGWVPIWYLNRSLPFHSLIALYGSADIALITPLKDGMNLVAKEFIAAKTNGKGVLIVSEMAGVAGELGEAIIVNPNNRNEIVQSLKKALKMPHRVQIESNRIMQERLRRYDIMQWVKDFMDSLSYLKKLQGELSARRLTFKIEEKLVRRYRMAGNRLILLDYDGTLLPLTERPEMARPDKRLLTLLDALAGEARNMVIIVSGRDKTTLDRWFKGLNVGLVAEHGAWLREPKESWEAIEILRDDWKREMRSILELYVSRTPGSFIEEKTSSLAWHYRRVEPELASVRAMELKGAVVHISANFNLDVLKGNKVIEIKRAGINKGRAVMRWISKKRWGFILSMGDDWTDEDVFGILPEKAYSVKVGLSPSRARFSLDFPRDTLILLKRLVEVDKDVS